MPRKPRPSPATIKLYVARSGPRAGDPECQAAFHTVDDAIRFLTDLHGLEFEDTRRLKREMYMPLKRKVHGAEQCAIYEEQMSPPVAARALTGELYLRDAPQLLTPRKINKALKLTIPIRTRKSTKRPRAGVRAAKQSLTATQARLLKRVAASKPTSKAAKSAKPATKAGKPSARATKSKTAKLVRSRKAVPLRKSADSKAVSKAKVTKKTVPPIKKGKSAPATEPKSSKVGSRGGTKAAPAKRAVAQKGTSKKGLAKKIAANKPGTGVARTIKSAAATRAIAKRPAPKKTFETKSATKSVTKSAPKKTQRKATRTPAVRSASAPLKKAASKTKKG